MQLALAYVLLIGLVKENFLRTSMILIICHPFTSDKYAFYIFFVAWHLKEEKVTDKVNLELRSALEKWNYCMKWHIILEPTALDLTLNFQSVVVQIQLEIEHALLFSGTLMFPHNTPTSFYSYHDQKSGFSY